MLSKSVNRLVQTLWRMENWKVLKLEPYAFEGYNEPVKLILTNKYLELAQAYNSGCLEKVKNWVEPRLYVKMKEDLKNLQEKGQKYVFDVENLEINYFNLAVFVGVNIMRDDNFEKDKYIKIATGTEVHDEIVGDDNRDDQVVKNMKFFMHPEAPCNVITGISMRIGNGVKVVRGDEVLQEGKVHFIQMENEAVRIGSQIDGILTGNFQKMLEAFSPKNRPIIREDWFITDIDEFLQGNPHIN